MKGRTALMGALLVLGGCDYVQVSFGGNDASGANEAATNTSLVPPPALPPRNDQRPADAGVTTSRSLQPPTADGSIPPGGKDPAAGGPPGEAVDPSFLVGRWGDEGTCASTIDFFANGTFRSANGGTGNWRVEGDRLVFSGQGRSITLRLRIVNRDLVIGTDANGASGRSQRC